MFLKYLLTVSVVIGTVKSDAKHYGKGSVRGGSLTVSKTASVSRGFSHCAAKCNKMKTDCQAFSLDEAQSCSLGKMHPADIICPNEESEEIHYNEDSIFDEEEIFQIAVFKRRLNEINF